MQLIKVVPKEYLDLCSGISPPQPLLQESAAKLATAQLEPGISHRWPGYRFNNPTILSAQLPPLQ